MTKEWYVVYRYGIPQAAFASGPDVTAYITGRKWTEVEIRTCELTFTELATYVTKDQLDAFGTTPPEEETHDGEGPTGGDRGEGPPPQHPTDAGERRDCPSF